MCDQNKCEIYIFGNEDKREKTEKQTQKSSSGKPALDDITKGSANSYLSRVLFLCLMFIFPSNHILFYYFIILYFID